MDLRFFTRLSEPMRVAGAHGRNDEDLIYRVPM